MVVGKFKDFQKYCSLHPDFQKAFAWLAEQKTDSSPDKVLIDGEKVWGKVITDANTEGEKFYEAHRDYIDIHYVLEGAEEFGYSHVEGLSVVQEYNPADDYGLYRGEINRFVLSEGYFCIVFPEDAHIPGLKTLIGDRTVRAMAKIRV